MFAFRIVMLLVAVVAYQAKPYEPSLEKLEEDGGYFDGDIIVPKGARATWIDYRKRLWPNATVQYTIQPEHFTEAEQDIIMSGMKELEKHTCIRFVERTDERDYVTIVNAKGCSSVVGRWGGPQKLKLEKNSCVRKNTVVHELMHALGIFHEHNRHDRHEYVKILAENVQDGKFNALNSTDGQETFGVPYDYVSIMHYSRMAFSKNGKPTMIPLKNTEEAKQLGRSNGLTKKDILKLNIMYCEETK